MKIFIPAIVNILLFSLTKSAPGGRPAILLLFKEFNCQGGSKQLTSSEANIDPNWGARIRSVRMIGTWVLYEGEKFNKNSQALLRTEVHTSYSLRLCINFEMLPFVISAQLCGNPSNVLDPMVTFFTEINYHLAQYSNTASQYNLPSGVIPKSIILHGSAEWTLCAEENYKGYCRCLHAELSESLKARFIPASIGVTGFYVRSVKMGCDDEYVTKGITYNSEMYASAYETPMFGY